MSEAISDEKFLDVAIRHPESLTPDGAMRLFDCVKSLRSALAAEKERADKAEVERDNLLGKSSGKCVHEVDKFSIRGCYNCVLLQAEAAESALLAEKEKALKWERQCVVRGDQWEAAEERVRQLESERNSLVKSTGEHVTVREEYQSQIAALTEKLCEVRKNITEALESMTATQYAFEVVWPEIEKISGPDWDGMKAGMNQEYALLGDAIEVSKLRK